MKAHQRFLKLVDDLREARADLELERATEKWLEAFPAAGSGVLPRPAGENGREPLAFDAALDELCADAEHLVAGRARDPGQRIWSPFDFYGRGRR